MKAHSWSGSDACMSKQIESPRNPCTDAGSSSAMAEPDSVVPHFPAKYTCTGQCLRSSLGQVGLSDAEDEAWTCTSRKRGVGCDEEELCLRWRRSFASDGGNSEEEELETLKTNKKKRKIKKRKRSRQRRSGPSWVFVWLSASASHVGDSPVLSCHTPIDRFKSLDEPGGANLPRNGARWTWYKQTVARFMPPHPERSGLRASCAVSAWPTHP